jgi:hypothetical protein
VPTANKEVSSRLAIWVCSGWQAVDRGIDDRVNGVYVTADSSKPHRRRPQKTAADCKRAVRSRYAPIAVHARVAWQSPGRAVPVGDCCPKQIDQADAWQHWTSTGAATASVHRVGELSEAAAGGADGDRGTQHGFPASSTRSGQRSRRSETRSIARATPGPTVTPTICRSLRPSEHCLRSFRSSRLPAPRAQRERRNRGLRDG